MNLVSFNRGLQSKLEEFLIIICENRGHKFDPTGRQSDIRKIEDVYQSDGGNFWVLESAGSIVGTIALKIIDRKECIGEIKRYFVLPTLQGQGLGQMLIGHAIDVAIGNGLKKLRLDTMRQSKAAIYIFKKNGFYEIEKYNNNDVAEIFMEKDLSNRL
ncbi:MULTISPECIES: GNAT family N-acetyltransferase [Nostoc]|uniref:GNAT family N-acetyltransferase n=2 Tax=Nostoc TaxID=1177 RepID=A0ABR8IHV8_9NOSO|nr:MULTISPECIES: GNAT family N-acetyltransferase [Nostoc]MBD2564286.1 GNAT family N-acetyltransferase [Nostoc linckia FACHB-391]MBD2650532.1 GNAT family N-acetyltransferase [Nostoc foliaceum FACHB-393]